MPKRSRAKSAAKERVRHITFGRDADRVLRKALRLAGRDDEVIPLWDDLSVGPIDPPERVTRWRWATTQLVYFPYQKRIFSKTFNAWEAAWTADARRVAWVSRRSVLEYCGLLRWIWRLGDEPVDIVDLTGTEIEWHYFDGRKEVKPVMCLSSLWPAHVQENALWDLARPLAAALRKSYRETWHRLRAENAPFRVLKAGEPVSAPMTYFDERLLADTGPMWRKVARVMGKAMELGSKDEATTPWDQLHGRLHKLVWEDRLELQGEMDRATHSEIRRPPGKRKA